MHACTTLRAPPLDFESFKLKRYIPTWVAVNLQIPATVTLPSHPTSVPRHARPADASYQVSQSYTNSVDLYETWLRESFSTSLTPHEQRWKRMSESRVTESDDRDIAMSTQNLAIRDSAPPQSSRTFEGSHAPSWFSGARDVSQQQVPADVWAGAISRLQTQVSLNTSMLESHRRQHQEIELKVLNLSRDLGSLFSRLDDITVELRARPTAPHHSRHDPGDLDVLAGQVEAVTAKANEVDGLKMQLELMRNRMKRWEEQSGAPMTSARPRTSSSYRESSVHEAPPASLHGPHTHLDHPPQHQPLPPMRTASMSSPIENRTAAPHPHPQLPVLESQNAPRYPLPADARQYSAESSRTMQPSAAGSFRPTEPLPPPSALPGWRSSESLPLSGGLPPPSSTGHSRPPTIEPEPHHPGWASVNANHAAKRPFEEPRRSPYESPGSGSPKRPKLAPIMPRSSYGDESFVPSSIAPSATGESTYRPRSRAPSDVSQTQSRMVSTPDSASVSSYRFITSTAQADSQESWRPENERKMHMHHHHHHGPGPGHGGGRNRGRRGGRGGGRRGRGGGVQLSESQQLGTPEWERADWTGSQVSPNGYYHALHPYSPRGPRGGLMRRGGGGAGTHADREHDFSETSGQGQHDDESVDGGLHPMSGGKKTRTKPIRNAEGVLIRKDGRPDMRSVSSANNLRKVHAKKEAERAEEEEESHPATPGTSAERDEAETEEDRARARNEDLASRQKDGNRTAAERLFPRDAADVDMKPSNGDNTDHAADPRNGSQMTDVVMREMSDAQADDHRYREDTKMETVEEASEENERGSESREPERQTAAPSPD